MLPPLLEPATIISNHNKNFVPLPAEVPMLKCAVSMLLALLFYCPSHLAAAITADDAFAQLADKPISYAVEGVICEQLVALQMQEAYPAPQYKITTGIAYAAKGRTLGELDVVVMDTQRNHRVIEVIEVKCTKSPARMLHKAKEQLARFVQTLASKQSIILYSTDNNPRIHYQKSQFISAQMGTASVSGSQGVGYNYELPFSKDEAMAIRRRIQTCQKQGQCARPPLAVVPNHP